MNILVLSSNHPYRAAGLVALDIYKGLKRIEGNNIRIVVKEWDEYENKDISPIDGYPQHLRRRFVTKARNGLLKTRIIRDKKAPTNPDYHVLDYDQTITHYSTENILSKAGFVPDVIVIMFMQHFLSYRNIYELNNITGAPIYQLLMDMAPYTAGCHYAWECINYQNQCGNCTAMYSQQFEDQSYLNWRYKKHLIEVTDITVIAAAEWQWRQVKKSGLFANKEKVKILSPTDDGLFRPDNKSNARRALNLPMDKKIVLCGAVYPEHRRKGYKELIEALRILSHGLSKEEREELLVVMAGETIQNWRNDIPLNVHLTGHLSHVELARAYQAADIFLNASIEDSGPTMINQAITSGTPVVAFEMGVAPDLVKTGVTGYMARLKDPSDFAVGIRSILSLSKPEYDAMSSRCRRLALETCSLSKVAHEYQKLFDGTTKR